ncbi:hypothetical protein SEVIR_4G000383v4 [Setaria viridis]
MSRRRTMITDSFSPGETVKGWEQLRFKGQRAPGGGEAAPWTEGLPSWRDEIRRRWTAESLRRLPSMPGARELDEGKEGRVAALPWRWGLAISKLAGRRRPDPSALTVAAEISS